MTVVTGKESARGLTRVVCAAVRAEDGEFILGIRHYSEDMIRQINARPDGEKFKHREGDDQGFVDSRGNYLTRKQALMRARFSRQHIWIEDCRNGELCSEALY